MRSYRNDYLQASPATFAPLTGNPTRFGAIDIDGAVNLINTNYSLFTAAANLRDVKITCCNRTGNVANIRVAHIDGVIGALADEDYLFYDVDLIPYETKILNIDGANASDTIMVRSSIINVGFMADGQTMSADYGYRRLGAATVLADTNTVLYLATGATENITVVACNRDASISSYIRVAVVDAAVIGSLAAEDWIIYSKLIPPSESVSMSLQLDLQVNHLIAVRSTSANTHFLSYGRLIT